MKMKNENENEERKKRRKIMSAPPGINQSTN